MPAVAANRPLRAWSSKRCLEAADRALERVRNNGRRTTGTHSFFWASLTSPGQGGAPIGPSCLTANRSRFSRSFEGVSRPVSRRRDRALRLGWVWLSSIEVNNARGGGSPPTRHTAMGTAQKGGATPLLGNDVWSTPTYLSVPEPPRRLPTTPGGSVGNWPVVADRYAKQLA